MNKKLVYKWPLAFSAILFFFAASFSSCKNGAQPNAGAPPPVSVVTELVRSGEAIYFDVYPATLAATQEVELRAQVTGYVTGIHVADGAVVKKGQKLYTIDAQLYDANYDQALAQLKVQEANLLRAQKDADRYRALDKREAIAKQQVDYAEANLAAAEKQVEAAKAAVRAQQTAVRFATIYAPFSGTIGLSQVRLGAAVVAGQTVLNVLSADEPIAADVAVNQEDAIRFAKWKQAPESSKDLFSLHFTGFDYEGKGKIEFLDRAVDPQTGTLKVRFLFSNTEKLLRPGMNAELHVKNDSPDKTALLIPNKAITEQLGEFFVYLVGDSSKVTQQKVITGRTIGDKILVTSGLNAGDKIVVEGIQNLREGAVIQEAPASKK